MKIIEAKTNRRHNVEIRLVEKNDFKNITKRRYFFEWKTEKKFHVYKLTIENDEDILGLVSFEIIPDEWRIHIRLLTVSKENKGKEKKYEKIVGNLLTFVSKISLREFAEMACVSLKPKDSIRQHYIDKYGMNSTGVTLSIELPEILNLIKEYDND